MTTETKPLACSITKNLGTYNLASTGKQWCVQVLMPDGKWISETWDQDDEPATEGEPPSVVIELIVERLNSYLFSSRRTETLARVDSFRPMFPQMDDAWARSQIAGLERRIRALQCHLIEEMPE
jgi:hypothetical protein